MVRAMCRVKMNTNELLAMLALKEMMDQIAKGNKKRESFEKGADFLKLTVGDREKGP